MGFNHETRNGNLELKALSQLGSPWQVLVPFIQGLGLTHISIGSQDKVNVTTNQVHGLHVQVV
jgi:hypothetical protein